MYIQHRRFFVLAVCLFSTTAFLSPTADARRNQSNASRLEFARQNPCPSTGNPALPCPGYIMDFATPLCAGGSDDISNMRWQIVEDAKEKEKRERQQCKIETRETGK